MIFRLATIWASSRNGFCNSVIAASMSTDNAPTSSRCARRWLSMGLRFVSDIGLLCLMSMACYRRYLVHLHSGFDELRLAEDREVLGINQSSMLRATPGLRLMKPARSRVSTIW